jgi:hypothetical protein
MEKEYKREDERVERRGRREREEIDRKKKNERETQQRYFFVNDCSET